MEYITEQTKFLPIPPPLSFSNTQLFFYILIHNVPWYLTLTFTNSVLLFHTDRVKGSTQNVFAQKCYFGQREKRASKICCLAQRNATFILHCTVFE